MTTKPTKYTKEFVIKELSSFLETIKMDKEIVYIKQLLEDREYSYRRLSEWMKKYDNREISDTMGRLREILESRLFVGALKGKYNAKIAVFGLKNNFNWVEKHEIDQKIESKLSLTEILAGAKRLKQK